MLYVNEPAELAIVVIVSLVFAWHVVKLSEGLCNQNHLL